MGRKEEIGIRPGQSTQFPQPGLLIIGIQMCDYGYADYKVVRMACEFCGRPKVNLSEFGTRNVCGTPIDIRLIDIDPFYMRARNPESELLR